ncbi:hypothetical protein AAFF_G00039240 [Aldrovandia affinis]|uniref:Uncharacterized protein n=1 Tax=Aldrovandia affinis TaxID=143900 RepID=A0AAD7S2X5_9TELE|nr:hypothetical protein AAFF_G00039240 [Aldrovandia affinis]
MAGDREGLKRRYTRPLRDGLCPTLMPDSPLAHTSRTDGQWELRTDRKAGLRRDGRRDERHPHCRPHQHALP